MRINGHYKLIIISFNTYAMQDEFNVVSDELDEEEEGGEERETSKDDEDEDAE